MKFTLQQNMWQGFEPVEIELPDAWDVEYHGVKADSLPALTKEEIRAKINRPFGLPPLRELARGRQKVAIVFDDISRGTPTQILAEIVLEELHAAGIQKEQIRFLCALGMHGAHNRRDFVCKLGEEIVSSYDVYNHNCYENNLQIGVTKRGIPVQINAELMACDLKIGLGAMLPHIFNAFGGGGKILFPGMASDVTVNGNHTAIVSFMQKNKVSLADLLGDLRVDAMRTEVEEMTRMVGEFFKIDCLFNTRQEIVDVYSGDAIEEYYAAVPKAQEIYVSKRARDKQIVIVNANARSNEANIALALAFLGISRETGGDIVLIDRTTMGQIVHYLFGMFGDDAPGRQYRKVAKPSDFIRRIICFMNRDSTTAHILGNMDKQVYVNSWAEVMELLRDYGPGTKVSVLADGSMQYFEIDPNLKLTSGAA
ncbi:MAG: lactate racemase domain-containing protein [Synergistaceae bacterium]|jgi:nickel-dependent lactate racemase|nr:lactate racemase domain-containing protein [Synergistaceae bacterium]